MAGFQACEAQAEPQAFLAVPHAPRLWACGVLFQPRAPPPEMSVVDKASDTLGFPVWFLDVVVLVIFVDLVLT